MFSRCWIQFILFLGLASSGLAGAEPRAYVHTGVVDLRQWDFEKNPSLPLRGAWEFYWGHFIDPLDFQGTDLPAHDFIKVPGSWNKAEKAYSHRGYVTYRARIRLAKLEELALYVPLIYVARRVYIDGKLVAENGQVGRTNDPRFYTPRLAERYYTFQPTRLDFDIVIHASSFEFYRAGITLSPPSLGKPAAIALDRERDIAIAFFIVGALVIMGIYHICLFTLRTEDRSSLYFGVLCLLVGIYMLAGKGRVVDIILPDISFANNVRTYQVWMLALPIFSYFTHELFPRYFSKRVAHAMAVLSGTFFIYVIFAEPRDFVGKTAAFQVFTALLIVYLIRAMVRACRGREEGAKIFSGGALVMAVVAIHDILLILEAFESIPIGAFGLFTFILFQSFLLARKFSSAFHRVEESEHEVRHLNENLETIVLDKTRDIRSIMTHIPLGIFTLAPPAFSIQKDYSDHLKIIFNQDDLTNLNGLQLIFAHADMSPDDRSQAESALVASLGDNVVTFQMNQHVLPHEIVWKTTDAAVRILDLTWNPIADAQNIVEKVLVTVRDVTDIRALEEKTREKDAELEMIGELLNTTPESFDRFLSSCREFLADNRKYIQACTGHPSDLELIKMMFINFHTIKGTARSLQLKGLTRTLHEIEQFYAKALQQTGAWDLALMRQGVDEAEDLIQTYEHINRHKLGRHMNPERRVEVTGSQISDLYQNISRMENLLKSDSRPEAFEMLYAIKSSMFPYIYVDAADVFKDACRTTDILARDLGKALPRVSLSGAGIFLSWQGDELLRKILVHMIRNTMDHGLETPDQRLAKGKSPEGEIELQMRKDSTGATLIYRDDGRGLDLQGIKDIAVRRGFIRSASDMSTQDLADLVFQSGLSTAHHVNDISGRGVGMDAVKRYVQAAGGDIRISLDNPEQIAGFHAFRIEVSLPQNLLAKDSPEFLSRQAA
ncbi:MAG TPA: 7TM diverse intracellular signaling domain-containing protein [Oligoflexus sp.]|uniref:7TM diverse intracellular signaling domain-containing protein n=1 Tax=Oligoflexus sp. TaxID=1971216 RepID=UPI002D3B130E|nr:7TM diverse intracellular signaling domain-containing protein [Oligoflexus sp.]HYX34273.1 7TM diverse intracellular signaling domain-containing protein [Oligoflexus sp.]